MIVSPELEAQFKNIFLDAESSRQALQDYISSKGSSDSANCLPSIVIELLLHVAISNLEIVHASAESPIERIFLGALNYFSIMLSIIGDVPPLVLFMKQSQSAIETAQENRRYWADLWETRQLFKGENPDSDADDFVDFGIAHGMFHQSERDEKIAEIILLQDVGVGSTYRLMPQARFPQLQINGRSIRTDAYIWKPNDEHFNAVLECDGYEFHSDKVKFTSDRARDRLLQSQGFDVLRFSGSEINNHPIRVAQEVLANLYQHHQKTRKPV